MLVSLIYKVVFLFLDSCRPLSHALAWPRLTNHSLPPKRRWFVHNIISPGLPPLKKLAADKHVFAELPLVTPFSSNLTRLTPVSDGPRGRFNCISTVSCKGSVFVEVLTNFYGRFFVEEGQFIKYTPATPSLHLGSHFFQLLTPPRFGALNIPEVNQFTGNCFCMVRIVLKITFLGLRYPKGVTGSVPLCPIMALATQCVILTHCYVTHHPRQLSPLLPRFGFLLLLW